MRRAGGAARALLWGCAVLVLALAACGGDERRAAEPRPLPEEERALRPGLYRTEVFEPPFTFEVGGGWTNVPPEASDMLVLRRDDVAAFAFVNVQHVYEPHRSGLPTVAKAPDDLVGWFGSHPYLRTSEPKTVTVGGVEGTRLDVTVEAPEGYAGPCAGGPVGCVDVFSSDSLGPLYFPEDLEHRVVVLEDVDGRTVVAGFGVLADRFEEEEPKMQGVMDTVEWRDR